MVSVLRKPAVGSTPPDSLEAQALIHAEHLCKSFSGRSVLESVCFVLRRGDVVLLRGPNGSGKTTLLDLLSGHAEPDVGKIHYAINSATPLTFAFPRPVLQRLNPARSFTPERSARAGLCRTWQEPRLFGSMSLSDNVAVARRAQVGENPIAVIFARSRARSVEREVLASTEAMLARLGLAGRGQSSADMISLAQTKVLEIGRAVHTASTVLCLDEPLAGLDGPTAGRVLHLLRSLLRNNLVGAIVVAEHESNAPAILSFATRVWSLAEGRLRIERPQDVKGITPASSSPALLCSTAIEAPNQLPLTARRLPGGASLSSTMAERDHKPVVMEVKDLVLKAGRRLVVGQNTALGRVKGIDFAIHEGERLFLRAPNGWGKTTLLRALAGIHPIARGRVAVDGTEIMGFPAWQRSHVGVSLVPALSTSFGALTVAETLRLARVSEVPVSLRRHSRRRVADLSTGERQVLSLYCGFAKPTRVALLDEPFLGLDMMARAEVETLLGQQEGAILISGPSNPDEVDSVA